MIVKIVGKCDVSFKGERGEKVNLRQFHAIAESRERGFEGQEAIKINYSLDKGEVPDLEIGEEYEAEYNRYGKLRIV